MPSGPSRFSSSRRSRGRWSISVGGTATKSGNRGSRSRLPVSERPRPMVAAPAAIMRPISTTSSPGRPVGCCPVVRVRWRPSAAATIRHSCAVEGPSASASNVTTSRARVRLRNAVCTPGVWRTAASTSPAMAAASSPLKPRTSIQRRRPLVLQRRAGGPPIASTATPAAARAKAGTSRAKDFPMLAATLPPSRAVLPAVAASRAPARSGAVTRPKPGRYRVIELFTLPSTDSRLVCQELPSGLAASPVAPHSNALAPLLSLGTLVGRDDMRRSHSGPDPRVFRH